jgi:hypothetical protein
MTGAKRKRRKGPTNYAQYNALVRKDLFAIARYRFGTASLPDTPDGRRFLRALLAKHLPVTLAYDIAPWCRDELCRMARDVADDPRPPTRDRLGNMIEFEFEELKRMRQIHRYAVRHVAPYDVQPYQVQEFFAGLQKLADAEWQRRKRKRSVRKEDETVKTKKLSPRADMVRNALNGEWMSTPEIMRAIAPRLRPRRDPGSLRRAVHRSLDELASLKLAEIKVELDQHNRATRFARRST